MAQIVFQLTSQTYCICKFSCPYFRLLFCEELPLFQNEWLEEWSADILLLLLAAFSEQWFAGFFYFAKVLLMFDFSAQMLAAGIGWVSSTFGHIQEPRTNHWAKWLAAIEAGQQRFFLFRFCFCFLISNIHFRSGSATTWCRLYCLCEVCCWV